MLFMRCCTVRPFKLCVYHLLQKEKERNSVVCIFIVCGMRMEAMAGKLPKKKASMTLEEKREAHNAKMSPF